MAGVRVYLDDKVAWLRAHLEGAGFLLVPEVTPEEAGVVRVVHASSLERFQTEPFLLSRVLFLKPSAWRRKLPDGLLVMEGLPKSPHIPSFKLWFSHLVLVLKILQREFECEARLNAYISDSFANIIDSQLLAVQKEQIEKLNQELSLMSRTDYLTGLYNRRAFFEALAAEKRSAKSFYQKRQESEGNVPTFACLMMDIDHFKQINDTYGHLVGDQVLKKIGEILNSRMIFREKDILARYGGEEIVAVLVDTTEDAARYPAERFREVLSKTVFRTLDGQPFNVTISIGIAEFRVDEDEDKAIARADKALYAAKHRGRNRTVLYSELEGELKSED